MHVCVINQLRCCGSATSVQMEAAMTIGTAASGAFRHIPSVFGRHWRPLAAIGGHWRRQRRRQKLPHPTHTRTRTSTHTCTHTHTHLSHGAHHSNSLESHARMSGQAQAQAREQGGQGPGPGQGGRGGEPSLCETGEPRLVVEMVAERLEARRDQGEDQGWRAGLHPGAGNWWRVAAAAQRRAGQEAGTLVSGRAPRPAPSPAQARPLPRPPPPSPGNARRGGCKHCCLLPHRS